MIVLLTLSHGAYSALGIMHQSWIAMLGGSTLQRSRLVSWREGLNSAEFKLFAEMRSGKTSPGASASYKVRF